MSPPTFTLGPRSLRALKDALVAGWCRAPIPAGNNEDANNGEARQGSQGATPANEFEPGLHSLTGRSDSPTGETS